MCKYDVNIITDTLRSYHTPCEIQSVVIASFFAAWVMMAIVVAISVVTVVTVVVVILLVLLIVVVVRALV